MTDPAGAPAAMTSPPQLSVLIPAWNAAERIERALASILEEREVSLECVVIDDGSTDATADVVASVAVTDPRVVLVRLAKNGGVSNARNEGLAVARGRWLAFLDADDRLLPGAVAALMRPTADPTVRAVIGQRIWTDGEETWVTALYDIPDIRQAGRKSLASHPGLLYYASATGRVIDRSLTDGLRFEGRVLGDQPWTIRALLRAGDGIEVIGDTVYEWSRPRRDAVRDTITAGLRTSAARAAEMTRVARGAFAEVAAEVDARMDDSTGSRIKLAYLDRLARSDVGPALAAALDTRDPDLPDLFLAIGELLASQPPYLLARSEAAIRLLVAPPLRAWWRLPPAARTAYLAIAQPVLAAEDGRSVRRLGRSVRGALALIRRLGLRWGPPLASVWLWATASRRSVSRRVRGTSEHASRHDVAPIS